MVVDSWTLNDHPVTRDLSWWICPHGDHRMAICMRCYHPFDFIYVELKRHRPHCPRWYSGRHRRTLDPDTLALVGPDDIDRPMAYWYCMYGNCHRTEEACARCYQSRHTLYSWAYGGTCPKTYSFKHRRASIQCRWHWYLIDHIDLHMGATTLDLHQAALRRLKRKNGDYED